MYAKALREQMAAPALLMQGIVDKAKAESNRALTSDEVTAFKNAQADFDRIEASVALAEKQETTAERLAKGVGPVAIATNDIESLRAEFQMSDETRKRREKEQSPYAKAFAAYLRSGEKIQTASRLVLDEHMTAVQNTMSTAVGSQGGYIVPTGFSAMLEEGKKWFGGVDGIVGKFQTGSGNPWPWPTVNDTANQGRIIGQNVQVSETDLAFGQVTFNAYIGSSDLILIPLALKDDSYFDLDALVARLLGIRLGRLYNNKCTVGSGSGEPTGIVTAGVAAGNIFTLANGNTASIAYNNFVDVQHSVDPAYRENPTSRWMFSDTLLKLTKKLVDSSNRPLWQPGLTASFQIGAAVINGFKPKILESEYVINNDMAVPAASAYSLLYGDLSCYKVREVAGGTVLLVLVERYADYMQVGYIAFQRFDGNLIDAGTHPVAVMRQSAV